ncbi:hypothetical protein FRC11_001864 [Ceratobasidium sp. 423]|nr:hypothetical protein FRC11_001864 [Ceratobasidium sp. 423]
MPSKGRFTDSYDHDELGRTKLITGSKMATRLSIPVVGASRRLARSQVFSTSSYALVSPKTGPTASLPDPKISVESEYGSPTEPLDSFRDPSIPETPESKSLYRQSRPKPSRRPGVKPPPTLALPSSMLPPPPRVPLPIYLRGGASSKISEAHENMFSIYMKSLNEPDDEPTLDDLDALRPPPSTIRAAFEGVIGSGRALLPENHPLHLAIEQLGAQEATVGGGPKAKRTVVAGSRKAKDLEYKALYAATEGMITRSFTVAQLTRFAKETRMQGGCKKVGKSLGGITKPRIIHRLMNIRWAYSVSPSELFIFLGRDGEDLLHLSEELKMRINVDRQPSDPPVDPGEPSSDRSTTRPGFIIRASGTKSNHEKLRKHIENQRDTMTIKIVGLPTGSSLSSSLLQSISRISGAFVENVDTKFVSLSGDGSSAVVSITARNPRSAYTAERLAQRAAMEAAHRSQLSLFALLKDEKSPVSGPDEEQYSECQPNKYELYPFGTQGFRVRNIKRVDLGPRHSPGDVAQLPLTAGSLDIRKYDKDEVFILTGEERSKTDSPITPQVIVPNAQGMVVRNAHGEVVNLGEYVLGKDGGEDERNITTTFGHVVFKVGKTTTLDSPLPNPVLGDSILEWVNKHGSAARVFAPGQVPSAHLANNVTSVHRLQYRTVEGEHLISVNVEIPDNDVEPPAGENNNLGLLPEGGGSDGLELESATQPPAESTDQDVSIPQPGNSSGPTTVQNGDSVTERAADPVEEHSSEEKPDAIEFMPLPIEIAVGTETAFELMLPESTMDISVQVSNTAPMAKSMVPEALEAYLDELSKFFTTDIEMPQPHPPQHLDFDGRYYMLVKNTSARRGISNSVDLPHGCTIVNESSLDLENNIRTMFTQLNYNSGRGKKGWDSFIAACQNLASKPYERSMELKVSPT